MSKYQHSFNVFVFSTVFLKHTTSFFLLNETAFGLKGCSVVLKKKSAQIYSFRLGLGISSIEKNMYKAKGNLPILQRNIEKEKKKQDKAFPSSLNLLCM